MMGPGKWAVQDEPLAFSDFAGALQRLLPLFRLAADILQIVGSDGSGVAASRRPGGSAATVPAATIGSAGQFRKFVSTGPSLVGDK